MKKKYEQWFNVYGELKPDTPSEVLERLSTDEDWEVRRGVASHPNTPVSVLVALSNDEEEMVQHEIALNPNTPASEVAGILSMYGKNDVEGVGLFEDEVFQRYTFDANTPIEIVRLAVEADDANVRKAVAELEQLESDDLVTLLGDEDYGVRLWAASNPNKTEAMVIERLGVEEKPSVIAELLNRYCTCSEYCDILSFHEVPPMPIMKAIADSPCTHLRETLAQYEKTPREILESLSHDEYEEVRQAVAEHPSTPSEVLARLSTDEALDVRESVVKNPHTPEDVLVTLSKGTDRRISVPAKLALEQRHPNVIAQCEANFGPDWDKPEQGKKNDNNQNKKGLGL